VLWVIESPTKRGAEEANFVFHKILERLERENLEKKRIENTWAERSKSYSVSAELGWAYFCSWEQGPGAKEKTFNELEILVSTQSPS